MPTFDRLVGTNINGDLPDVVNASLNARIEAQASARGDWRTTRPAMALTTGDHLPLATWTNVLTTGLSSPVAYRPSACNTGVQVSDWDGQDDPNMRFEPGVYHTTGGANSDQYLRGMYKPGASVPRWPVAVSFVTSDVAQVELSIYGALANHRVMVEVNGRFMSNTAIEPPATFTGNNYTLLLTFPTARSRTIRLWINQAVQVAYIRVPTGGTITKPAAPTRTVAVVGDSFVDGSGSSRAWPDQGTSMFETFALGLARALGADAIALAGVGGSGWITAGQGTDYEDRIATILALDPAPDVVIFYGSTNDGTDPDETALTTAVTNTLAACSAVDEVYVIGALREGYEANAAIVKAATEAAGRTYVDLDGFMFGTGNVAAKTGDGNNDYYRMSDNAHPTFEAHRAIVARAFGLMVAPS